MNHLQVISNRHERELFPASDLTVAELLDYCLDYIDPGEAYSHRLFKYKGYVYDVNEFMPVDPIRNSCHVDNAFQEWDGYQSDSFFSGIVIRWTEDYESVIVGRYSS